MASGGGGSNSSAALGSAHRALSQLGTITETLRARGGDDTLVGWLDTASATLYYSINVLTEEINHLREQLVLTATAGAAVAAPPGLYPPAPASSLPGAGAGLMKPAATWAPADPWPYKASLAKRHRLGSEDGGEDDDAGDDEDDEDESTVNSASSSRQQPRDYHGRFAPSPYKAKAAEPPGGPVEMAIFKCVNGVCWHGGVGACGFIVRHHRDFTSTLTDLPPPYSFQPPHTTHVQGGPGAGL